MAIGAIDNDGNGNSAGQVRIYENIAGLWTQIGNDIDSEAAGDRFGYSVSLSSDGSIVAIGAILNAESGINAGHVRVYNFITGIEENTINTELSINPNPTTGLVLIKNEELEIKNVSVFDIYGREVLKQEVRSKECEVDLSHEPKGIYIIKAYTDKGVAVRKVILE